MLLYKCSEIMHIERVELSILLACFPDSINSKCGLSHLLFLLYFYMITGKVVEGLESDFKSQSTLGLGYNNSIQSTSVEQ